MRLGIYGGTFDPVHYGHLLLAESCREQLSLEQVWFLPAAIPPHKQQAETAPASQRLDMLELAIGGHESFSICTHEVERGGVNYTVDTLRYLLDEDPSRELFFLMGADSLRDLADWHEPADICQLAIPAAVARALPGPTADVNPVDYGSLRNLLPAERLETIRAHQVTMPRMDLSSSDIRRRVSAGRSIRYMTPRAVEKYIAAHKLYESG